jgi:hypothetical protein
VTWTVGQEVAWTRDSRIVRRGKVERVYKNGGCYAMGNKWTSVGSMYGSGDWSTVRLRSVKDAERGEEAARRNESVADRKGRLTVKFRAMLHDAKTKEDVQAIADALGVTL